jgi:hypothetical protein
MFIFLKFQSINTFLRYIFFFNFIFNLNFYYVLTDKRLKANASSNIKINIGNTFDKRRSLIL